MPRQANSFVENNFVKGLITEATGLNFPEQAVTETDNCVFDEKGVVRRRRGVDLEYGYEALSVSVSGKALSVYLWEAAAGSGDNAIVVVQVGSTLYFYLTDGETVSDNQFDSLSLSTFLPSGSTEDPSIEECQFAAGKGYLFVASPVLESFYVEFDADDESVSATAITVQIRDFEGVEDGVELRDRPASLTALHEYNICNQGWNSTRVWNAASTHEFPVDHWNDELSNYPSHVDVWWYFKNGSGDFDPNAIRFSAGNTPAPKGHFILDYYNQDRTGVDRENPINSFADLPSTTAGVHRASTIAFHAGRVWYSGVTGAGYSNTILFSQIIEADDQIGACHQKNDPTVEDIATLLPTDGGTILIPDSGTVVKLFSYEDSMLVFATNGIWRVSGSEGLGFRANDYSVTKVSSVPCLTAASFVSIAGVPSFWNAEGIYSINSQQGLGSTSVNSLTDTTIRSFIEDIPYESRKYVRGAYNRGTRVVTWVYRTTSPTNVTERYSFDAVLNLNTISGAFYGWTFDTTNVTLNGVVVPLASRNAATPEAVTDSSLATVTNSALVTVYAFGGSIESMKADTTKFLVSFGSSVTFADEWADTYVDWYSFDDTGVAYTSTFTTGYKVHGNGMTKAQPTYINLFFATSEHDNSIDFRSLWQYATSGSTGRWSTAQRIVTTDNNYSYTRKRIKSRGSGNAYQFRVTSVTGQPFELIGWAVFETMSSGV